MNRIRIAIATVLVAATGLIAGVAVNQPSQAADVSFATDYYPAAAPYRIQTNVAVVANVDKAISIGSGFTDTQCIEAAELNFTYAFPVGGDGWLAAWGAGAYQNTSLVSTQLGKASSNAAAVPVYFSGSTAYVKVRASRSGNVSIDVHGLYITC